MTTSSDAQIGTQSLLGKAPSTAADATSSAEWKANWTLVVAAMVGFSFHSIATYATGLFIEPLQQEFGWSRGQITTGLAIAAISTVPLSPLVGAFIDRWGSRRIALPGLILTACSLASFGTTGNAFANWIALWCGYALIGLTVKSTVWTYAVSSEFTAGRGLALAVMLSGTALTQTVVPPLTNWLIESYGWREAWFWLGFGWGAPAFVLSWLFLRNNTSSAPTGKQHRVASGMTLREAIRNPALIKLGTATLFMMTLGIAVIVHQVPILAEIGIARDKAAWLASISGIAGIAGKLITGALMDKFDGTKIGAATIAASSIGFGLLLLPPSTPSIVLAIVIIGYAVGTKLQITAYLTSRMTGMDNFGKIFGLMNSLIALGAGLGPVISGFVFDSFGSYFPLIAAGVPGSIVSGLLIYRTKVR